VVDMPEEHETTIRKPSWSMDVKIISHISDMLDQAGDLAIRLEEGDGNAFPSLKAILQEVFLRFGGDLESEGSMLDPKAKSDLINYFKELRKWEESVFPKITDGKIPYADSERLKDILRMIRVLLYSELNRLFIRFITIYSEKEKMERYS